MRKYWILIIVFSFVFIWSGINSFNFWYWLGEIAPNIIGAVILILTFNKFRFTYFTYIIILVAFCLVFIGAHYTFPRVPFIFENTEILGTTRNNFDKLGHLFQGIVPTLIAREVLIFSKILKSNWVNFISLCICMTTTASYEIIESITCIIAGTQLDNFLGTQGYIWDSQTDMLAALLGGLMVITAFKPLHDRIIKKEIQLLDQKG